MLDSGHVRGGAIVTRLGYIEEFHGKNAVKQIFQKMQEEGYAGPIKTDAFRIAESYPIAHFIRLLEAYMDTYGEEAFVKMAEAQPKRKGIVGWFMSWAGSPEAVLKRVDKYWSEFYDFGKLEGKTTGPGEGKIIGRGVSPAPVFCKNLTSYYVGVMEFIKTPETNVVHTKCVHNGDEHCEWLFNWG